MSHSTPLPDNCPATDKAARFFKLLDRDTTFSAQGIEEGYEACRESDWNNSMPRVDSINRLAMQKNDRVACVTEQFEELPAIQLFFAGSEAVLPCKTAQFFGIDTARWHVDG